MTSHSYERVGRRVVVVALVLLASLVVPVSAASARTLSSNGWTTEASFTGSSAGMSVVRRGDTVTLTAYVTSTADRTAVVNLEVVDSTRITHHRYWDDSAFSAGQVRTFTTTWEVAADERLEPHTVRIGVFGPGWAGLIHWNDDAFEFDVAPPGSSPTATTVPTVTSVPSGGSRCGLVGAVFCEDFGGGRSGPSRSGDFDAARISGSRFSGNVSGVHAVGRAAVPSCRPGQESNPLPPGDTLVCEPSSVIGSRYGLTSTAVQSYGDNSFRINQPFDIAGRTGTIQFDASLDLESNLYGYASVAFTSEPVAIPGTYIPNARSSGPRDGLVVPFSAWCGTHDATLPYLVEFRDFAMTYHVDQQDIDTCPVSAQALTKPGHLNRVTLKISATRVEVWATDFSPDGVRFGAPKLVLARDIALGFTRGYVHFGSHNHSTLKYSNGAIPSWTVLYDNIAFDGPAIAADRVVQVPDPTTMLDANTMKLGRDVRRSIDGTPLSVTIGNVDLTGATSARLGMSRWTSPTSGIPHSQVQLFYKVNNAPWRSLTYLPGEVRALQAFDNFGSTNQFIDLPLNELVNGTNTIQFHLGTQDHVGTTIANIDLILRGGGSPGSPPTSTTTSTSTTTPTTTSSSSTTTTSTSTTTTTTTPPPTPSTVGPTVPPPVGVQFFEDFSSPASVGRFVSTVFHGSDGFDDGNGDTPNTLAPSEVKEVHGDHDMSCGLPTTTRSIRLDGGDRSGSFYYCAPNGPDTGHVMTSMNATGYAQVDFAPAMVFRDVSQVCWDVNQTRMGGRKWLQVAVIPEALFQQNHQSLVYVVPSLETDVGAGGHRLAGDALLMSMLEGSTQLFFGPEGDGYSVDFAGFRTEDKAQRFKHCMTDNGNGTISFELQRDNRVDRRTLAGHFPDGPVRVIFSDDTYDGPKGDLGDRSTGTDPRATWHWDNITIK